MHLTKGPLIAALVLALAATATGATASTAAASRPPVTRTAFTPPMGWSSWSFLRSKPTEQNIEAQGLAMRTSGLEAHGYRYVNIDAGWSDHLDAYGRDAWNTTTFPDGIPAV